MTLVDLRRFCSDDRKELALPMRAGAWVVGTDGMLLVAHKVSMLGVVDLANNEWLRLAINRLAPDALARELMRVLALPRDYRVPLGVLRAWSLEVDFDRCMTSKCFACGGRMIASEPQRLLTDGAPVVIDRELVRRVLYPLKKRDDLVEVHVGALDPVVFYLGDTVCVVMPMQHGDGADPFDLKPYFVSGYE